VPRSAQGLLRGAWRARARAVSRAARLPSLTGSPRPRRGAR
jgi:hypothetical protein